MQQRPKVVERSASFEDQVPGLEAGDRPHCVVPALKFLELDRSRSFHSAAMVLVKPLSGPATASDSLPKFASYSRTVPAFT
jgi:hypothetical protein